MAADFTWKRHDTAPAIQGNLTDAAGNAVNLTGATVKFIMTAQNGLTPKVNATATVADALNGLVSYPPTGSDTDTAGDYWAEWQVTYADSTKQTFPNPGYVNVTIVADLDNA